MFKPIEWLADRRAAPFYLPPRDRISSTQKMARAVFGRYRPRLTSALPSANVYAFSSCIQSRLQLEPQLMRRTHDSRGCEPFHSVLPGQGTVSL